MLLLQCQSLETELATSNANLSRLELERSSFIATTNEVVKNFSLLQLASKREIAKLKSKIKLLCAKANLREPVFPSSSTVHTSKPVLNPCQQLTYNEIVNYLHYTPVLGNSLSSNLTPASVNISVQKELVSVAVGDSSHELKRSMHKINTKKPVALKENSRSSSSSTSSSSDDSSSGSSYSSSATSVRKDPALKHNSSGINQNYRKQSTVAPFRRPINNKTLNSRILSSKEYKSYSGDSLMTGKDVKKKKNDNDNSRWPVDNSPSYTRKHTNMSPTEPCKTYYSKYSDSKHSKLPSTHFPSSKTSNELKLHHSDHKLSRKSTNSSKSNNKCRDIQRSSASSYTYLSRKESETSSSHKRKNSSPTSMIKFKSTVTRPLSGENTHSMPISKDTTQVKENAICDNQEEKISPKKTENITENQNLACQYSENSKHHHMAEVATGSNNTSDNVESHLLRVVKASVRSARDHHSLSITSGGPSRGKRLTEEDKCAIDAYFNAEQKRCQELKTNDSKFKNCPPSQVPETVPTLFTQRQLTKFTNTSASVFEPTTKSNEIIHEPKSPKSEVNVIEAPFINDEHGPIDRNNSDSHQFIYEGIHVSDIDGNTENLNIDYDDTDPFDYSDLARPGRPRTPDEPEDENAHYGNAEEKVNGNIENSLPLNLINDLTTEKVFNESVIEKQCSQASSDKNDENNSLQIDIEEITSLVGDIHDNLMEELEEGEALSEPEEEPEDLNNSMSEIHVNKNRAFKLKFNKERTGKSVCSSRRSNADTGNQSNFRENSKFSDDLRPNKRYRHSNRERSYCVNKEGSLSDLHHTNIDDNNFQHNDYSEQCEGRSPSTKRTRNNSSSLIGELKSPSRRKYHSSEKPYRPSNSNRNYPLTSKLNDNRYFSRLNHTPQQIFNNPGSSRFSNHKHRPSSTRSRTANTRYNLSSNTSNFRQNSSDISIHDRISRREDFRRVLPMQSQKPRFVRR